MHITLNFILNGEILFVYFRCILLDSSCKILFSFFKYRYPENFAVFIYRDWRSQFFRNINCKLKNIRRFLLQFILENNCEACCLEIVIRVPIPVFIRNEIKTINIIKRIYVELC